MLRILKKLVAIPSRPAPLKGCGEFTGFASAADLWDSMNRWFDVTELVAQSLEGWIWWTVGSGYAGRGSTSSLVHEAPIAEEDT